jgi:diketogulonate reductase-like aldo/keto reductase
MHNRLISMERRWFGSTQREVSVIGQGTWYSPNDDRTAAIDALRCGIDCGMTHIDTAEMYLSGEAETWVGQAIRGHREEVFLVSKVLPQNATRRGTIEACERSLTRLGTDRLDSYLLHWRGSIPLEETLQALEKLRSDGKILFWGVSNFDIQDICEARAIVHKAKAFNQGYPVCDQVLYNLKERAIEHAVIPFCEQHQIAVVAYSPFGHGDFPDLNTAGGRVLKKIAKEHGATPRQVALRFLMRWRSVFTIVKAANPAHTTENGRAGNLRLSEAEIAQIDRAFPLGPPPPTLPVL